MKLSYKRAQILHTAQRPPYSNRRKVSGLVYGLTEECQQGCHIWPPHTREGDVCLCGRKEFGRSMMWFSGTIKTCPKMIQGNCHCLD